jgi:hypothetical protein
MLYISCHLKVKRPTPTQNQGHSSALGIYGAVSGHIPIKFLSYSPQDFVSAFPHSYLCDIYKVLEIMSLEFKVATDLVMFFLMSVYMYICNSNEKFAPI